jgi:hypothetical protein
LTFLSTQLIEPLKEEIMASHSNLWNCGLEQAFQIFHGRTGLDGPQYLQGSEGFQDVIFPIGRLDPGLHGSTDLFLVLGRDDPDERAEYLGYQMLVSDLKEGPEVDRAFGFSNDASGIPNTVGIFQGCVKFLIESFAGEDVLCLGTHWVAGSETHAKTVKVNRAGKGLSAHDEYE